MTCPRRQSYLSLFFYRLKVKVSKIGGSNAFVRDTYMYMYNNVNLHYLHTCSLFHHICLMGSRLSGTSLCCITSSSSDNICTFTIAFKNECDMQFNHKDPKVPRPNELFFYQKRRLQKWALTYM